jgi:DNA-binding NarL/FixJ family response regulator
VRRGEIPDAVSVKSPLVDAAVPPTIGNTRKPEATVKAAIALGHGRSDSSTIAATTTPSLLIPGTQPRDLPRELTVSTAVIRVMLVDDHTIVREGLRGLLHSAPDIQVVGEASNGVEAIAVIAQCAPDVVVMDLDMPGGDGTTATREISKLEHPPRVLILTMHTEEERLIPLLEGGASGFLSKDTAEHEFVDAIRVVASGEVFVRPTVARLLAANARPHAHRSPVDDAREKLTLLSGREQSVLRRIAEGYSGVEIGRMLDITPKTVDTYKSRIAQKLGFTHRTDYVRFALRLGLIDLGDRQQTADEVSPLRRQPGR